MNTPVTIVAASVALVSACGFATWAQTTRPRSAEARDALRLSPPPFVSMERETSTAGSQSLIRGEIRSKVDELSAQLSTLPPTSREQILRTVPLGFPTLRQVSATTRPATAALRAGQDRVVRFDELPKAEQVIETPDFMPVYFYETATVTQRAVVRIAIKFADLPDAGWGTGFLVSKTLLLTNNHVIPSAEFAERLEAQFDYKYDRNGQIGPVKSYDFATDVFLTDKDLDYTLIRLRPRPESPPALVTSTTPAGGLTPGDVYGFIPLKETFMLAPRQAVNIIQHPQGGPKVIVTKNNLIEEITATTVSYTADTEPGSSGSPVFNNSWTLVALHHAAGKQAPDGKWMNNEGIRIDKIMAHLRSHAAPEVLRECGLQ